MKYICTIGFNACFISPTYNRPPVYYQNYFSALSTLRGNAWWSDAAELRWEARTIVAAIRRVVYGWKRVKNFVAFLHRGEWSVEVTGNPIPYDTTVY